MAILPTTSRPSCVLGTPACPHCKDTALVPNGGFLTCPTCNLAITRQALLQEALEPCVSLESPQNVNEVSGNRCFSRHRRATCRGFFHRRPYWSRVHTLAALRSAAWPHLLDFMALCTARRRRPVHRVDVHRVRTFPAA